MAKAIKFTATKKGNKNSKGRILISKKKTKPKKKKVLIRKRNG